MFHPNRLLVEKMNNPENGFEKGNIKPIFDHFCEKKGRFYDLYDGRESI
ncbi:hypothetical protein Q4579_06330 [Photobacterium sp. 1_MG-2023]|nr:hypothetical protein [Photobacterium sp. 1_MG-2023]